MSKIKINNFGPIKSGFDKNEGFIDIKKVTVFIGNQGSGKSSIAKLISTMSWLEKALYRGEVRESYVTSYNRFVKEYCNYQNLKNYFLDKTEIEYIGEAYSLIYKEGRLVVINSDKTNNYIVPKIMYVPAERNFLSAVENPDKLKGLPKTLSTFWAELERSQQELSENLELPVGGVKFEFDKLNRIGKIVGRNYKLRLSEASSGFQSFVPLYLVSRNLALAIDKEKDQSRSELSGEESKRLRSEIDKILSNSKLSEEFKQTALEVLSSKYKNESFLNIVEEIEQNLYPKSQKDILFKLLEFANITRENKLILTTHSPYIINYLTLSIKGYELYERLNNNYRLFNKLKSIVPENSCISSENAVVYELTEKGEIIELPTYKGLPSDENFLNQLLGETNDLFADLLEIEQAL